MRLFIYGVDYTLTPNIIIIIIIIIICQELIAFFKMILFSSRRSQSFLLRFCPNVSCFSLQFIFSPAALGCVQRKTTACGLVSKYF